MKKTHITPAARAAEIFAKHKAVVTLGGEPTYVPIDPEGAEWNTTAVGPTKLGYAFRFAEKLVAQLPAPALCFYAPGKSYPGETNPRWTLHLLWRRNGKALMRSDMQRFEVPEGEVPKARFRKIQAHLLAGLSLKAKWLRGVDPLDSERTVAILPLDHGGRKMVSAPWLRGRQTSMTLIGAEGPAGLRLPLSQVPEGVSRRALVLEINGGGVDLFLPPLLQAPFEKLLRKIGEAMEQAQVPFRLQGYVPSDERKVWEKMSVAPDPGVLEINLPACADWQEYDQWIKRLDIVAAEVGLRTFKQVTEHEQIGTGGGNHLLFGGPSMDENAFFRRPGFVTSIIRYWQKHPSLSYLFTGHYVGSSSQAPRPDESARALYDLEMAYRHLESLGEGDHRYIVSETLRHLHTDGSGNTHRSEISFDKFWSVNWEGGCRGLIEFRAIETLPKVEWTSAVALLWTSLAASLLEHPCRSGLIDHGAALHDQFFLPSFLWDDLRAVLADLRRTGIALPTATFREIWNWRFPLMLDFAEDGLELAVRKGHEGWPLLCETPIEGGTTSRFVDTSIERLEFLANAKFAAGARVFVQGRRLPLSEFPGRRAGAGLRYRRSQLYPSLHPGIAPHLPLQVAIVVGKKRRDFELREGHRQFEAREPGHGGQLKKRPCQTLHAPLVTCDLRIA